MTDRAVGFQIWATSALLVASFMVAIGVSGGTASAAPACSRAKLAEILGAPKNKNDQVLIDCDVTLSPKAVVRKRLLFRGERSSGVTFDCRGGTIDGRQTNPKKDTIEIASRRVGRGETVRWIRPENVTIRNCTLIGSVRVMGMGRNGQARFVKRSSHSRGHIKRAQDAAPTKIRLTNMTIDSHKGRTPIYIAPGVTYFSLVSSKLTGQSRALAVYLDAESAHNTFRNNAFNVKTDGRELIAVDGSADNRFIGNRFSALQEGGIYIYRNCGEGGTVRHLEPRHNEIINNIFYYKNFSGHTISLRNWTTGSFNLTGKVPAIWVGSRGGMQPWCGKDSKYPFGSGADNGDFARDNVIADNQIVGLDAKDMIELDDKPNIVFGNRTVKQPERRPSGCYVAGALPRPFLASGETATRFARKGETGKARATCTGFAVTCEDGVEVRKKLACR